MARVAVAVPGISDAELVGYIAMCLGNNGEAVPRVCLDLRTLEGVVAADAAVPSSAIAELRQQLSLLARDDFRLLAAAARIEVANETAGRAQERLSRLAARHFILSVRGVKRGDANFARQLTILDDLAETRHEIRLPGIPVDQLRAISGVPFEIRLPTAGSEIPFDASRPLLKAAVDRAAREADALHRRQGEITTEQVLARL